MLGSREECGCDQSKEWLPPVSQMTKGAVALEEIETCVRIISLNAKVKEPPNLAGGAPRWGINRLGIACHCHPERGRAKVVLDELKSIAKAIGVKITQGKERYRTVRC